jgi:photosystem II stability/assembly factor-like uncharacterized protein
MTTTRKMAVGTEDGVVMLSETPNKWEVGRSGLAGKKIGKVVGSAGGTITACVWGDGVYTSGDAGASWDRVLEGDVRALGVDPRDPWTIYAGTEPVALFRSRDGGDNWTELEGLRRMPQDVQDQWWFPQPPHEGHVCSIFVDPDDSNVITLGLEHGGIVRSRDGGENWEDLSAGVEYLDVHMVARDPSEQRLYYTATARAFYRSEHDGQDWCISTVGMDRDYFHDFVVRPGEKSSLFLATANGSPPSWIRDGGAKSAIYRSEDGGLSWQQLGGGLPPNLNRMVGSLVGDPIEDSRLYATISDYVPNLPKGQEPVGQVWASPDRGDTWEQIVETPSPIHSVCVVA